MADFIKFKSVCVELMKTPSVENLARLKTLIEESEEESLQQLQEYILFPLFIITSNLQKKSEQIFLSVGDCLQALFHRTTVNVFKIFSDLLVQLLLLVEHIDPNKNTHLQSEEVKLVAVKSILSLINSASNEILTELLTTERKLLLGHFIFTLLKVVALEEMKELRVAALDTLMKMCLVSNDQLGSLYAPFFPGICTYMLRTINGAIKQSHMVTKRAVEVFSKFIRLILSNKRFENPGDADDEWLQTTRKNLHVVLEKVMKIPEMHWKVRIELVAMTSGIVEDCSVTLEPSLPLLVRKLVQLTADECLEVENEANDRIRTLDISQTDRLDSAVRQNLYDIVTCLPRIISQGISMDQLVILQELQGHLTLLGPRLEHSLIFSGLRQRLFKGLLMSGSLELTKVTEWNDSFTLLYLREERVMTRFEACCCTIGQFSNLADTVDYLLDVVRNKESYDKESVYVMKHVLKGATLDLPVFSNVVREYASCLTRLTSEIGHDIMLGQLMLLVIGEAAIRMGNDFNSVLLSSLKPVLEKAGHPHFHEAGVQALQSIANGLRLNSVSQLLEENADYFAPQLSFQLRNIMRYPSAIDLLRGLLLLSDIRMDHWLERMVQHALKGLDKCHSVRALPYVQVLELYSRAVYNSRPPGPASAKPLARGEAISSEELAAQMENYKANLRMSRAIFENPPVDADDPLEAEDVEPEDPEIEEEKPEPPSPQVVLVASILERCTQLLPQSADEQLYSSMMQTIRCSIDVLCNDENIFLPKVHQLWDPLRNQLLGSSHLKQRQAFDIFLSLVKRCPDFIRSRAIQEVLPKLTAFLHSQASSSRGKSSRAHLASQAYKLQKSVLSSMATLIEFLDPPVIKVGNIIQTTSLFLSSHQIPELQNLAKENLIAIARYHSGSVWLTLQSMAIRRTLSRPGFRSITVGTIDESNEYTANVERLIELLFPSCRM